MLQYVIVGKLKSDIQNSHTQTFDTETWSFDISKLSKLSKLSEAFMGRVCCSRLFVGKLEIW